MTHFPELRAENMQLKHGNSDVERKIKNLEKSNSELTLENSKLNPENCEDQSDLNMQSSKS